MNDWHRGDFMDTYSGKQFHPFDPRPDDIEIIDIAHALAMTCRFGGHTKQFYSVAQHCVLVASKASPANALRALMHDAPEAYTGDLVRPIKKHPEMVVFEWVEETVERAICARFGLPYPICNDEIKRLDNRILLDEREQVMTPTDHDWNIGGEPLGVEIDRWSPEIAREKFLNAWSEYSRWQSMLRDVPGLQADQLRTMAARLRDKQMPLFEKEAAE